MTAETCFECRVCGAEYRGYAEYCNHCGSEQFRSIGNTSPPPSPLRGDGSVLVAQGTVWLIAVVYLLGEHGARHPLDLLSAWGITAALGGVLGLVTRNLRAALLFAGLGAAFVVTAGLVRGVFSS